MAGIRSKYYSRLIITILIVSLVPLQILGILSFFNSSRTVQNKVNESNQQLLKLTQMRVEQAMESIYNYYTLLADSNLINLQLDQPLDLTDVGPLLEIQGKLVDLQRLESLVESVHMINLDKGWVISNDYVKDLVLYENREIIDNIENSEKSIYWEYVNRYSETDESYPGGISLIIKIPFNKPEKQGALVINLSTLEFSKYMEFPDKQIIVIDDFHRILHHDQEEYIGQNVEEDASLRKILNSHIKEEYYQEQIGGVPSGIVVRRSDYIDWTYLAVYPLKEITRESRTIGVLTLAISGLIMLTILILSFFGARRIYRPIEYLYHHIQTLTNSTEDAHDVISYIDAGILSLESERHDLEEKLIRQKAQVDELFFWKLLRGEADEETIKQKTEMSPGLTAFSQLAVVVIRMDRDESSPGDMIDEDLKLTEIRTLMGASWSEGFLLPPIVNKHFLVALIHGCHEGEENFREHLFVLAESIQKRVEEVLGLQISIGISRICRSLLQTESAYREGLEALYCQGKEESSSLLFYQDVQPGKYIRMDYPRYLEKELLESINRGSLEEALICADRFIDAIYQRRQGYNELKLYLNRLLISIIQMLHNSGASINTFIDDNHSVMEEIHGLAHIGEIKGWLKTRILEPLIPVLSEQRSNKYRYIIDEIEKMVEREYDCDLTLEICADRLNYHPSYVWKIMKNELAMSFTDYLYAYRLRVSKKWLTETDMTIGEIAEKLKYANAQNFIRYFKKMEKMTPGKYRKSRQKSPGDLLELSK